MPQFPRYNSKATLTSQTPSAPAAQDNTGKLVSEVGQKIGGDVMEFGFKWGQAVDTIQKTTAMANFKTGMLDIEQRAQNDPDYNNSDKYFKEIDKLKTDNLKGFSNKNTEMDMAAQFNYLGKVGQIGIENLYKKKMIDMGQTASLKLIDTEVNNPTESSLLNIKTELAQQVQAGIFDQKDAYLLERKANDDLGVNRINRDLYQAQTPEQVDAVTQRITSGAYETGGVTIEPDKKKALLDIAERAKANTEKKIQAQQIEAMAQNRVETLLGVASGKNPISNLNMADIAEYDPQLAGALAKVKDFAVNYNPKLPPTEQGLAAAGLVPGSAQYTNMRSYARSITDVFMQNDNKSLGDFMVREFGKKGDGLTSSVKLAAFANLASLKAKVNNQQTAPDVAAVDRLASIKAGIKFLQASSTYLSPVTIGEFIVKNYLSGASSPKQVMQEAKDIHKDKVIERYKSIAKLPSMPNKIVDGEASVEDVQAGENELKDGFNGNYADESRD